MTTIPSHYWRCPRCVNYNHDSLLQCPCGYIRAVQEPDPTDADENEAALHDQIEFYCHAMRWPYIHSRMDRPTTNAKGVPDFIIFAPGGRTLIIELKSKTGKQTTEQRGFQMQIEKCGHVYHLLRSYPEFLNLIEGTL